MKQFTSCSIPRVGFGLAFLLVIGFSCAAAWAAEGGASKAQTIGLAKLPETYETIKELAGKFEMYTKDYQRRLGLARVKAVELTDAEEVKRIDRALKGEAVLDFTTRSAQDARKFYDEKLAAVTKTLIAGLSADTKKLLQAGKTDDAIFIKDTVTFLEQYAAAPKVEESAGKKQYKAQVEADKDWQELGVTVKTGSVIWIEAQGKWAPGWPNNKNRPDLADADTYRVQYRIRGEGENIYSGGVKLDFEAKSNGMIEARMGVGRNAMRSEARGTLSLRIQVKEPTEAAAVAVTEPLENVLRNLIKGEAPAAAKTASGAGPATTKVIVKSTEDWADSGIAVKVGDKIKIEAVGEWSPNDGKKAPMSADMYQYDARIGESSLGKGGKVWEVTANHAGPLQFRASFYGWAKKREFTPTGTLQLTVTVTAGDGAAPEPKTEGKPEGKPENKPDGKPSSRK